MAYSTHNINDRFIPVRNPQNLFHPDSCLWSQSNTSESNYSDHVKRKLFEEVSNRVVQTRIANKQNFSDNQSVSSCNMSKTQARLESPVKILEIPGYKDDFYLNNVDWSQRGPLGIALDNQVYLYTPTNLVELCTSPFDTYVSSLKLYQSIAAVGLSNGAVKIYDLEKNSLIRTLNGHKDRVSCLSFLDGLLITGSKDKKILINDLRQRQHVIKQFNKHRGEICTIKPKNNSQKTFATGSSDGSAIIWDIKQGFREQYKAHKGAVKALQWCPWRNGILATGGGSAQDKTIKIWNTNTSKMVATQKIQSQISGLVWNQPLKMMITSHGFNDNQLRFWSLENNRDSYQLTSVRRFNAHRRRILNLIQSFDQGHICTVGADQNMKMWSLLDQDKDPFETESVEKKKDVFSCRI